MFHIYENAMEVAVCLSTSATMHKDHGACAWIKALNKHQPLGVIQAKNYYVIGNILKHLVPASERSYLLTNPEIKDSYMAVKAIWQGMCTIKEKSYTDGLALVLKALDAPWWDRAWVAQEFVAARSAVFLFDNDFVSSELLIAVMISIEIMRTDSTASYMELSSVAALREYYPNACQDSREGMLSLINEVMGNADLIQILANCCDRKATDTRDMV